MSWTTVSLRSRSIPAAATRTGGIYYYTTYDNRQITGVKLHAAELDSARLTAYPLADTQQIRWEN